MKIVTSLGTLMRLASDLGKAKTTGNKEDIQKAQEQHDNYVEVCRRFDEVRY